MSWRRLGDLLQKLGKLRGGMRRFKARSMERRKDKVVVVAGGSEIEW